MMKYLRTFLLIAAASVGAVGLQQLVPMARAAIWQWSTTAATNATADSSINWSEGQSPSSVNDSARAMMAVLAAWRNDLGAATATTGTSTAYVLTSNQGSFSAASTRDGFIIGFIPNVTNGAGPVTINVDGAGTKPLRSQTATNLNAGVLVAGSKYTAAYKFSTDEWLLFNNYATQFEVPLGTMLPYTGLTAPNANFVIPAGQCISRTTYATYFAQVGTTFSTCDGVTTFGVPDMRGRGIWGHDAIGGVAAGRVNATGCGSSAFNAIGQVCGVQTKQLLTSNIPVLSSSAANTGSVGGQNFALAGASTVITTGGPTNLIQPVDSGTNVLTIPSLTVNSGSPNTAVQIMNPVMGVNLILRVL